MKISLWYFHTNSMVGVGSYTANLYHSFVRMGHEVSLYRIKGPLSANQFADSKPRNFGYDIKWQFITLENAKRIMDDSDFGIITVPMWKGFYIDNSDSIETLLSMGCHVVVHDIYGISGGHKGLLDAMKKYDSVPIVIRETGIELMNSYGFESTFIPHPYIQLCSLDDRYNPVRLKHAISFSRFDGWKNPHWTILANEKLSDDFKIHIWGYHQKSYMKKEIIGKYEGWDDDVNFIGPMYPKDQHKFPTLRGFTVELSNNSNFVIDMTELAGDGGGTQYTFLEAMDGGAVLILNSNWINVSNSVLKDGENCIGVIDPDELVYVLRELDWESCLDMVHNNSSLLDKHSPEMIIPQYEEFLRNS